MPLAGPVPVTQIINQYGADGVRIAKGTITSWNCDPSANGFLPLNDYILDQSNQQLTEMGAVPGIGGAVTMTWTHTNVWALGKLIATNDITGYHFYIDDPLGTRRMTVDPTGVVEQRCFSLPYGDGETCSPTPTEHLFTGKERDAKS